MSSSVPSQRSFAEPVFCIRASTVMLLRFDGAKSRLRMRISETVYSNGRCIVRSRTVTRPFVISRSAIRSVGLGVALPAVSDVVISAAGAGFAAVGAGTADVVISAAGAGAASGAGFVAAEAETVVGEAVSAAGDFIRAARLLPSGVISNSAESPET